ncbi:hypothetical protein MJO10_33895, partial [Salmonella enterica subsp. enterica serovar Anatum]|nr:hypothetical protein [Salmonella enterica subsp. enterica serovar Anatum]
LAKLVLLVHFAIIFIALVVLGIVARLCGLSIWILIRILKDELVQDIETLLASGSPMSKSDGTSSVELEQIPQQVLFEIGRA